MGCDKKMMLMSFAAMMSVLMTGCAGTHTNKIDGIYEEGYRSGVAENMGALVEKFNGNTFPYIGGTWAAPLVQEVRMPAHVANGVFYPEHNELVIITPGEWKKSGAFPLTEKTKDPGTPAFVMDTANFSGKDITVLPITTESFQRGEK